MQHMMYIYITHSRDKNTVTELQGGFMRINENSERVQYNMMVVINSQNGTARVLQTRYCQNWQGTSFDTLDTPLYYWLLLLEVDDSE